MSFINEQIVFLLYSVLKLIDWRLKGKDLVFFNLNNFPIQNP